MEKEESALGLLKKKYSEISVKYGLPSFEQMNQDFSIEKASESETDLLIREIRKFISDKFSNYLRFIEALIHPISSPLFVFSIIKTLEVSDKEKLNEIYKKLAKREVELVERDIVYDEEKEVAFIKSAFEEWQGIKKEMIGVFDVVKRNWDNKGQGKNNGYFG